MNPASTTARSRSFWAYPARPAESARRGALAALLLILASGASTAQEPALNYLQHCAGCHMTDGAGSARNGVPDMRASIGNLVRSESGRAFLIQVAGVAQAPLSAPDLAQLMNWMLKQFSGAELPADFHACTADEVETLRGNRPADLPALRATIAATLASEGHPIKDY